MFRSWPLSSAGTRKGRQLSAGRAGGLRPRSFRPSVENLEDRLVLSTVVSNTDQLRAALATPPSDGLILLQAGTYSTQGDTTAANRGTFVINSSVTLEAESGAGVVITGANQDRVFELGITGSPTITFEDVTIENGSVDGPNGAGILAHTGTIVVLNNSTVTDNVITEIGDGAGIALSGGAELRATGSVISNNSSASGDGGGIDVDASTATLQNCQVTGNHVDDVDSEGGGVAAVNGSQVTITDSTIDHNQAGGNGGGIYAGNPVNNPGGNTVTVTNSTVSNNTAGINLLASGGGSSGGGIYVDSTDTLNLTNDTIANNTALNASGGGSGGGSGAGGGIFVASVERPTLVVHPEVSIGGASLLNTIVAQNDADNAPDVSGTFTDQGHNLIGISNGSTGFTNSTLVGTTTSPVVAHLGSLANNGGPTPTLALLPGSPAIDAGNDAVLGQGVTTDQRGVLRPQGAHVDIGAFEVVVPLLPVPLQPGSPSATVVYNPLATPELSHTQGDITLTATINANFPLPSGIQLLVNGDPVPVGLVQLTVHGNQATLSVANFLHYLRDHGIIIARVGHRNRVFHFHRGVVGLAIVIPGFGTTPYQVFTAFRPHHG